MRSAASYAVHVACLPCSSVQSGTGLKHAAAVEAGNFGRIHVWGHFDTLPGLQWSNKSLKAYSIALSVLQVCRSTRTLALCCCRDSPEPSGLDTDWTTDIAQAMNCTAIF